MLKRQGIVMKMIIVPAARKTMKMKMRIMNSTAKEIVITTVISQVKRERKANYLIKRKSRK